ncbi:MAG: MFS transporter [Rikenellaceae bacterium]|jgi:MFS family permease|nr:MFS transporter [Rikenellaceae bacterium]
MNRSIALNERTVGKVRAALFVYYFLAGLCFSSWASRIPDIKQTLSMGDAAWGTMLLMSPVGQIISMLFSGWLVPRLGSKIVLFVATICYGISLASIGMIDSRLTLVIALIVFGFFGNFVNISQNTQSCAVEDFCRRPIMSTFHGGWSLAGLVGGLVGLATTTLNITPFYHFLFIGAVTIVLSLVCYRYLQPDLQRGAPASAQLGQARRKAKPERFLLLLGFVGFLGMAAEGAMTDWNGIYLRDVVGVKASLAPMGLTAYMLTMATGRFFMDGITRRWGRKRVLQLCGGGIFLGLLIAVLLPGFVVSLIAFMIVGFGTSGIVPAVYSATGEKTRIPVGQALTIVTSVSFLGFLLGPPVIGYISNLTNLRFSYALIALFGIVIVAMASRLRIFRGPKKRSPRAL